MNERREDTRAHRTIADAKAHFAECIREVEAGRAIVLTRHGRPVARLVPIDSDVQQSDEIAEPSSAYPPATAQSAQAPSARRAAIQSMLDDHVWPLLPESLLGRGVTKRQREEILGYDTSTASSPNDVKTPGSNRRG